MLTENLSLPVPIILQIALNFRRPKFLSALNFRRPKFSLPVN